MRFEQLKVLKNLEHFLMMKLTKISNSSSPIKFYETVGNLIGEFIMSDNLVLGIIRIGDRRGRCMPAVTVKCLL